LAEIAQSLGRSIGSVKALQHRGLTRLAQVLNSQPGYTVAAV
jgi:RNA polymerase sigma-70 factor (ECF subfamily)